MPFLSAWWDSGLRDTSGLASPTKKTLTILCGPTQHLWDLLTGILECQVWYYSHRTRSKTNCSPDFDRSKSRILVSTTLGHNQGCVAFKTGIFPGLWDVLPCTNKTKYICKHLADGAPLTTVPPTRAPLPCADGWTRLPSRSSCFKVGLHKVMPMKILCQKGIVDPHAYTSRHQSSLLA